VTTSAEPDFGWLLDNFVRATPGTMLALVVSADGLLVAASSGVARTTGDQLAAVVSGIASLARGAGRELGAQTVLQSVIEMDDRVLLLMAISHGSLLAVAADGSAEIGLVGYEMALLARRAEVALTPQLVAALRDALPTSDAPGARVAEHDGPHGHATASANEEGLA
jgi:predicted regulator of Ras-like GTPase activity (Roadblock/LC7/MglB family)